MSNKCSNCGNEIEADGFFLCRECYYQFSYHYYRALTYDPSNEQSAIYDFLYDYSLDSTAYNEFCEYFDEEIRILSFQKLPDMFNKGSLDFLSLKDFEESKVVLRTKKCGFPKTHIFNYESGVEAIRVEVGGEFYFISTSEYSIGETEELIEAFEKISEYVDIPKTKKCLLCDNMVSSDEYLLCTDCYYKYKEKKLLLDFKPKSNSIELLDASYDGWLECEDGHIVKSQPEREIDNYFFDNNIKHVYEPRFTVYDGDEKKEIRPDFKIYIGGKEIYVEYWGFEDNERYENSKSYKKDLYEKAGVHLIELSKNPDLKNIRSSLTEKIKDFKEGRLKPKK